VLLLVGGMIKDSDIEEIAYFIQAPVKVNLGPLYWFFV
jgi:hypothetical protein